MAGGCPGGYLGGDAGWGMRRVVICRGLNGHYIIDREWTERCDTNVYYGIYEAKHGTREAFCRDGDLVKRTGI